MRGEIGSLLDGLTCLCSCPLRGRCSPWEESTHRYFDAELIALGLVVEWEAWRGAREPGVFLYPESLHFDSKVKWRWEIKDR